MITVDPAGLAGAAQRIADVLAQLVGGDPAHPPLGADPASAGAAVRLSTAGASLVAVIAEQAVGLTLTAAQILNVSGTFEVQDLYNKSGLQQLGVPDLVPVTGWAPPSPPIPPDIRPPMLPPPPMPGEVISAAVHSGDPSTGESFITAWREMVAALEGAADTVRAVAGQIPDVWDSPVATDTVRDHLYRYAQAFDNSASRAQTLSWQAGQHADQNAQARNAIPTPQQYADLRTQIQQVAAANAASGGKYAAQLAALLAEMTGLDSKTLAGYGRLHTETDRTTAGDGQGGEGGAGTGGVPGADAAGKVAGDAMSSDKAGQLAQMLPQMLQSMMGAAGGMVGGLMQMPQQAMQAGSLMAQQLGQQLGGMMKGGAEKVGTAALRTANPTKSRGVGGSGGGGIAGGGGMTSPPPAVAPATGPPPLLPKIPEGVLPQPVSPTAAGTSGAIPMGMPMGGMAGAAGHGAGGGQGGQEPPQRQKKVVTPPEPHTESVTGKVSADRIAMSAGAQDRPSGPPDDDGPPQSPKPIVRRITMPRRDDES